ncbi:MAG: hypothetical protein FJW94_12870 [Actinobacteria bacterium]|nr:hypothetical protein [Actinomycetota bacterium]
MAEVPEGGLYPLDVSRARVERDGDRLEVTGGPFGPAGVSSVDLPDGSTWSVDHLDPARLIALDVESADPAGSPLLVAAFGGDGAMLLVDRAGSIDRPEVAERPEPEDQWGAARSRPGPFGSWPDAADAGRLVVLGDLAQDTALDPLVRIIAVVEFVARVPRTPAGDLFEPLLVPMVDLAESLVPVADPTPLAYIDGWGKRLAVMGDSFAERFGDRAPGVVELLERRDRDEWFAASVAPSPMAPALVGESLWDDAAPEPAAALAYVAPETRLAYEAPETRIVERIGPSLLVVSTTRSSDDRWVRVLRRDSLVLLAQAPLRLDGLLDRAELLIPPDLHEDDIDVQIVDADQLTNLQRRPADIIRAAVRAGRAAASAERRRDVRLAMQRWVECAELWAEVGDTERADLAADRTSTAGGRFRREAFLCDDLDPYGHDPYGHEIA